MIEKKKSGHLIVISGPSGSGKGTIVSKLMEKENRWLSISTTSRPIRSNDKEGVTYNFVSREEFEDKIKEGYFLEYTEYAGNYYGTPKGKIKEKLEEGTDVFLEIEIEGASKIKKLVPEAIFIFIMPPSLKELILRLKARNTDSNISIIKRFKESYKEINEVTKYNYVVVNDDLEKAVAKAESIMVALGCMVDRIEDIYLDNPEELIHEFLVEKEIDNKNVSEKI